VADLVEQGKQQGTGSKLAGIFERFWAAYHASRPKGHGYFFSVVGPVAADAVAAIIGFLTEFQSKDNPEFYTL
jgi:hypothetical protein